MEILNEIKQMKVEAFGEPPLIISSNLPILKVIGILKEENAYEAFILKENKVNVVSIREILKSTNVNSKVSSIAFSIPKVSSEINVSEAVRLMDEYRIKALPIFEGNKLTKVVKVSSILEASLKKAWSLPINKLANLNLTFIQRNASIMKAKNLMVKNDIDHLPILESNKLVGMIRSTQIVFHLFLMETSKRGELMREALKRSSISIESLMEEAFTVEFNEDAYLTLEKMFAQKLDYALITLWSEPQGIVTFRDYMKLFYESSGNTMNFPVYITGLPDDFLSSELIKIKFTKSVSNIAKVYPDLIEAKANIKTLKKGLYEVDVNINTSKKLISFKESGWDLTLIFNNISKRLKRVISKKKVKHKNKVSFFL
jgi:predicted transcriptional regulator/ribosome-associated translation inhibitor RaiA